MKMGIRALSEHIMINKAGERVIPLSQQDIFHFKITVNHESSP
jgi:hypothetical protein